MDPGTDSAFARHLPPRSITEHYGDLLEYLDTDRQRRGWIHRLVEGYYDGWRPSRNEVADLIAAELGVLTPDAVARRRDQRKIGHHVSPITPKLERRVRSGGQIGRPKS